MFTGPLEQTLLNPANLRFLDGSAWAKGFVDVCWIEPLWIFLTQQDSLGSNSAQGHPYPVPSNHFPVHGKSLFEIARSVGKPGVSRSQPSWR